MLMRAAAIKDGATWLTALSFSSGPGAVETLVITRFRIRRGIRTVGTLDVRESLGVLLNLDNIGSSSIDVGLGQTNLLVGHVVGYVGRAQESVAQEVELVSLDAVC